MLLISHDELIRRNAGEKKKKRRRERKTRGKLESGGKNATQPSLLAFIAQEIISRDK